MLLSVRSSGGSSGGTWPVASKAIFLPVVIPEPITVVQAMITVAVQSGNVDVGLYREDGGRVWSAGSTAVAAAGIQAFTIPALTLIPALYFMAMACDNITASFERYATANARKPLALMEAATSFALPTSVTAVVAAADYFPAIDFHGVAA